MRKQKHVMVDLETLALTPDAMILSIGAVCWEREISNVCKYTLYKLNIETQNRRIDPATLRFHISLASDIIEENFNGKMSIEIALKEFTTWLHMNVGNEYLIWSKGVDFDIAILEHAYKQYNLDIPWNYRQRMCFRTIINLYPGIKPPRFITHQHTALADAKNQMDHLQLILKETDSDA